MSGNRVRRRTLRLAVAIAICSTVPGTLAGCAETTHPVSYRTTRQDVGAAVGTGAETPSRPPVTTPLRGAALTSGRLVTVAHANDSNTIAKPLAGKVIVIDPGHRGGNAQHVTQINRKVDVITHRKPCDSVGTTTARGYPEHAFTWDLAQRTASVLRGRGATVILTRSDDSGWGPCNTERAAIGNRAQAAAAISIHADGAPVNGRGFHVIAPGTVRGNAAIVAPSRQLALAIRDGYRRGTAMPYSTYTGGGDAITVRTDLGGLNLSRVPKVFIECGNMRNPQDAAALSDARWRQRAATALADGMTNYLVR